MRELLVVGVGPGGAALLTDAAREALHDADCVVTAPRHQALASGCPRTLALKDFTAAFDAMETEPGTVAVLVSGDPGLYSLLPALKGRFPNVPRRVLPGISSLQSLCAAVGEVWQDAVILSGHGRPLSTAKFLNAVERSRLTVLFCGGTRTPLWACERLSGTDLGGRVEVVVGERMSYPGERVTRGLPSSLLSQDFHPLSLILVRNPEPWRPLSRRPRDCDFERTPTVPMTREEVRSVLLDRLMLTPDAVLWDIGAGTGSVSVAAALECAEGEVHAVEHDPDALLLLERNRRKFHLHHLFLHAGRALDVLGELPEPTHVFIGGSGGELRAILSHLKGRKPLRVVVSAVTLDTLNEAVGILREWDHFEAVQVSVAASRQLPGGSLLMAGGNPVTLLCAGSCPAEGAAR